MKLALLSNFTVDPIKDELNKSFEIYSPVGFDTWQYELLNADSELYSFAPDAVLILLYVDAYRVILSPESIAYQWKQSIATFSKNMPHVPVLFSADCTFDDLFSWGEMKVFNLPIKNLVERYGSQVFYSKQYWYLNAMPYSIVGIQAIIKTILNYIHALTGKQKKCLAVDLDNTLWGGVIGEDGISGIALAETGNGAQFKDAQRLIKHMQQLGVILVILSKNNPEDVVLAFQHPDMILKHDDFVAEYVNWAPKSENVKECAKMLNIGLDSFVFLDDNPIERAEMKANAPEVTVVDFNCDSAFLPRLLNDVYETYFLRLDSSYEDVEKTKMYQENAMRFHFQACSGKPFEEYLKDMEMRLDFHPVRDELEKKRLFQLMNKTNQFNNGVKLSENDFWQFVEANNTDVFSARLIDRFGDFGIIAGVLVRYSDRTAIIDSLFMSCRAMGRKVENELLSCLKTEFLRREVEQLKIQYHCTEKNAPIVAFIESTPVMVKDLPERTGLFMEVEHD